MTRGWTPGLVWHDPFPCSYAQTPPIYGYDGVAAAASLSSVMQLAKCSFLHSQVCWVGLGALMHGNKITHSRALWMPSLVSGCNQLISA